MKEIQDKENLKAAFMTREVEDIYEPLTEKIKLEPKQRKKRVGTGGINNKSITLISWNANGIITGGHNKGQFLKEIKDLQGETDVICLQETKHL